MQTVARTGMRYYKYLCTLILGALIKRLLKIFSEFLKNDRECQQLLAYFWRHRCRPRLCNTGDRYGKGGKYDCCLEGRACDCKSQSWIPPTADKEMNRLRRAIQMLEARLADAVERGNGRNIRRRLRWFSILGFFPFVFIVWFWKHYTEP